MDSLYKTFLCILHMMMIIPGRSDVSNIKLNRPSSKEGLKLLLSCPDSQTCGSNTANRFSNFAFNQILQQCIHTSTTEHYVVIATSNISWQTREYTHHLFSFTDQRVRGDYVFEDYNSELIWDVIWTAYSRFHVRNFVLVSGNYDVFNLMRGLTQSESCGLDDLITSQLRFFLVTDSRISLSVQEAVKTSMFDNVALLVFNKEVSAFESAYTLMWRENQQREFQEIFISNYTDNTGGEADTCELFPNIRYGLNGRNFVGLAKEWLPEMYSVLNKTSGKLEFFGFYVDVFDAVSSSLNFTYSLVPAAGENSDVSWDNYVENVSRCQVDFGINVFYNNAKYTYNITTSFPVLYNDFVGVYMSVRKPDPYKLFLVFKGETLATILGALLFTMLLYLLHLRILAPYGYIYVVPDGSSETHQNTIQPTRNGAPRSSLFETDWQRKYKREENSENLQETAVTQLNFERKRTYYSYVVGDKNSSHIITRLRWKIKEIRKINSLKFRKPSLSSQSSKNVTDLKKNVAVSMPNSSGVYRGKRADIYNDNSHYVVDFTTKDFVTITGYQLRHTSCDQLTKSRDARFDNKKSRDPGQTSQLDVSRGYLKLWSRCEHMINLFIDFFGTVVNQDTLPQPVNWAPRVLLSAWSLAMIVIVATYTGNLTATFVDNSPVSSIKSFEDLVKLKEFRWGMDKQTSAYSVLENAERGSLLHKLYTGMKRFSETDPSVLGQTAGLIANIKSGNFVALVTSFTYQYFKDYTDLTDLVLINDKLMSANGGFIFPQDSEFNHLISEQIIKMTDAGILNSLFQRHIRKYNATMKSEDNSSSEYLDLENMLGVFYVCVFAVGIAFLALVAEIVLCRLNVERSFTGTVSRQ